MEYIRHNTNFKFQNTAVALGKFDGIHRGHQLLLNEIISKAEAGCISTVFTFDVSPVKVMQNTYDGMIMTSREREQYLNEMGIDVVIEYPFTYEFSRMEPEEFVKNILVAQMDMRFLVVGEDFHFGKNQSGDVKLLASLSRKYGFELSVKQKLATESGRLADSKKTYTNDRNIISSTRIKAYIRKGELEAANALMGHPYVISGPVISGNQIGRKISYPTANVAVLEGKVLPPFGVYAVHILVEGVAYEGIANLGKKPTVQETGDIGLETFIFDFEGDIYKKEVQVQLLKFMRREQQFDNMESLSHQIALDVSNVQAYLSGQN